MSRKVMLPVIILFLLAAGCSPFTSIKATEYVREAFRHNCPAGSRPTVLATKPYQGGMLVLVKNAAEDDGYLELFMVGPEGVGAIATGIGAGADSFSVNQLQDERMLIVFGEFAPKVPDGKAEPENSEEDDEPGKSEDGPAEPGERESENPDGEQEPAAEENSAGHKFAKALIVLKNWQIVEEELSPEPGFILIFKKSSTVAKFHLYDDNDQLLSRLDDRERVNTRVHTSAFVAYADFVQPFIPSVDLIKEVRANPFAADARPLIVQEQEEFAEIVTVLAELYSELRRLREFTTPTFDIRFIAENGKELILRKTVPSSYIVTYEEDGKSSHFSLITEDLDDLVAEFQQRYEKMPHEEEDEEVAR